MAKDREGARECELEHVSGMPCTCMWHDLVQASRKLSRAPDTKPKKVLDIIERCRKAMLGVLLPHVSAGLILNVPCKAEVKRLKWQARLTVCAQESRTVATNLDRRLGIANSAILSDSTTCRNALSGNFVCELLHAPGETNLTC